MRRLVLFMHTSLDGVVGGPNGEMDLIDDYWLFINPALLGRGIPLFKDIKAKAALRLVASNVFSSGVVSLHYEHQPT